ncbi:transporter protein Sec9 [Rhizoctonia solani]|uniref:Transporter protein Sec9 n=1 Tax=Rhizoctonia solani TaxID=456999 RepID=A0A8H7HJY8_9AGAM|nr:transporter protein Sec9 [Rhizoctonia solani]KAF8686748.1 hypothetical protein RHS04_00020 [Rhizoctonia solani]QRW17220.1 transporter protein Sec9 [Rhizoctonia solani]
MPRLFNRRRGRGEHPSVIDMGYTGSKDESKKIRSELSTNTSQPANTPSPHPPAASSQIQPDAYSRNTGIGDKYARGFGDIDTDRTELFAGHQPTQPHNQYNDNEPVDMNAEEEEEAVEEIKRDVRSVKQESVQSTRNALRIARQAEEDAQNTLLKVGDQSEKIANTERHLDLAKGSHSRAEDKTSETEKMNQSIFHPRFAFNKEKKRQKEEQRIYDRHELERLEREKAALDVQDTRNRLGRIGSYEGGDNDIDNYGDGQGGVVRDAPRLSPEQQQARQTARAKYQFEATASDDELEDELDDNLDEIHDVAKRLKGLAEASGQELNQQNPRLGRISNNADKLDAKIVQTTGRLKRIK